MMTKNHTHAERDLKGINRINHQCDRNCLGEIFRHENFNLKEIFKISQIAVIKFKLVGYICFAEMAKFRTIWLHCKPVFATRNQPNDRGPKQYRLGGHRLSTLFFSLHNKCTLTYIDVRIINIVI
jgi:hypothetical protein